MNLSKKWTKWVSVITCLAMLFGVAPLDGINYLLSAVSAETALAEIGYDLTTSRNLAPEKGFEESDGYFNGDSLKGQLWEGLCDGEIAGKDDWTSQKVSSNKGYNGSAQSLMISSRNNLSYRRLFGLDKNTQYTVSFYFNVPEQTVDSYMQFVSVVDAEQELELDANKGSATLAYQNFDTKTGDTAADEWKKAELTFYTGEKTDFYLLIRYWVANKPDDTTVEWSDRLYIDDFYLAKDPMAAPTYANKDFENQYVGDWVKSDSGRASTSLDTSNTNRLKVDCVGTYGNIESTPAYLKKGFTYTFSFDLNLSGVTDNRVPDYYSNGLPKTDADGNYTYENGADNWINWSISDTEGVYGSETTDETDTTKILDSTRFYCDDTTKGTGVKTVISYKATKTTTGFLGSNERTEEVTNDVTSFNYRSSGGFNAVTYKKEETSGNFLTGTTTLLRKDSNFKVELTFTAQNSGLAYFHLRLNGLGTYYVDNLTITQTAPADLTDYVEDIISEHYFKPVGLAIRLKNEKNEQGIRFKTRIAKELLCEGNDYGITVNEYGTVAMHETILGDSELTVDGSYTYNNKTYDSIVGPAYNSSDGTMVVFDSTNNYIDYTGVLMGMSKANYPTHYAVRSYMKYTINGRKKILYSDTYYSSIFDVAKEAYTAKNPDGTFVEADATREYLFNDIISTDTDKTVTVLNDEDFLATGFDGINSTVYHGFTFMADNHNRTYTKEQAAIEMDRLVDSGIESVRTIFKSQFAANYTETTATITVDGKSTSVKTGETFKGWNWESSKMDAFYRWALMLQERNIDIILNAGWHLHFIIDRESSISEVFYLLGYEEGYADDNNYPGTTITYGCKDYYGETEKYVAAGGVLPEDTEERRILVASLRYAEWIRQALLALKKHGVNNVTYILPFTETGYQREQEGKPLKDSTYSYDEWIRMVQSLHDVLKTEGIRNDYKIIGPSQSIYAHQERTTSFLYYYLDWENKNPNYQGMVDILSSHQYCRARNSGSIYDPYDCYDMAATNFPYYNKEIEKAGGRDGRDFWCDEFFAMADDAPHIDGVGAQVTQLAAGMTAAMNNGVNRLLSWQIFDTLWVNQTNTSGEFISGVHAIGTCPSFVTIEKECTNSSCKGACQDYAKYASYTPRVTYYGLNLLGKYLSNQRASVYNTKVTGETEGGLYVSSIVDCDGKITVLAVNTLSTSTKIDVVFNKKAIGSSATRYTYNPQGITPTEAATSLPSDGDVTINDGSFTDVIAPMSFSIYVLDEYSSKIDTELDMGNLQ